MLFTYFQIQGIHEEYQGLPIHICVIKVSHLVRNTIPAVTVCLLVSSADNLGKQFGPRSGPTKC